MPRQTRQQLEPSKPVTIRNAQIWMATRNFTGRQQQYNAAGDRNFCVLLDDDFAVELANMGWNIKFRKPAPDDPTEYRQPYIQITVKYGYKPPRIVTITSRGKTDLDETTCVIIDHADIEKADLIFVPYHWVVNDKPGVSAYLKSLFVTLNEDELEQEYAGLPDAGVQHMPAPEEL